MTVDAQSSPTASEALHYSELTQVAREIAQGNVSARTVTDAMLRRITAEYPQLNAYITVMADSARAEADDCDAALAQGRTLGPLHGVPIALKDILDVAGQPTTAAMSLHRKSVAGEDATVVRRLRNAGAVILGKLNLTEGVYAEHLAPYGAPLNPWNDDLWPGASSSGNGVAVAAGLCYGAIGSDTGGSIRLPSAANGITGLKPTWGRVSRNGVFELAASLDHIGPMARSAVDCAALLSVISGYDPADPTSACRDLPMLNPAERLDGMVIGLDETWVTKNVADETVTALFAAVDTLVALGAKVRPVTFPDPTEIAFDWFKVCAPQTAHAHRNTFPIHRDRYGSALADLLDLGNRMTATEYQDVLTRREIFSGRVQALFREVDLLICPALGVEVPSIQQMEHVDDDMIVALHQFTCSFTMSRNPTITMPSGFTMSGVPISVQFVAAHFREDRLIAAGTAFQSASEFHLRRPPGAVPKR